MFLNELFLLKYLNESLKTYLAWQSSNLNPLLNIREIKTYVWFWMREIYIPESESSQIVSESSSWSVAPHT